MPVLETQPLAQRIMTLQRPDGAIAWTERGIFDPWNHIEAAMGLAVAGECAAADKAYDWLSATQLEDGAWLAQLGAAAPIDWDTDRIIAARAPEAIDVNFTAYVATGLLHHYQCFGDEAFLVRHWPMLRRAMEFLLNHQRDDGSFPWAPGTEQPALVTGCCSIRFSLACGLKIASLLQQKTQFSAWQPAHDRLKGLILTFLSDSNATESKIFDVSAEKNRHAMDWYYPILTGLLTGSEANNHLQRRWAEFVIEDFGCRCVTDQPWVAAAESCELAIALKIADQDLQAREMLDWVALRFSQKEYQGLWMGYQLNEGRFWPLERPAWTAGAALLACDAVYGLSKACDFFTKPAKILTGAVSH